MAAQEHILQLLSPSAPLPIAVAGVTAHLAYWIHGEKTIREVAAWLIGHALFNISVFVIAVRSGTLSNGDILLRIAVLNLSFYGALFASITAYRLFFHRIRHFPGPLSLKLSKLSAAYANIAKNQDARRIGALHEQYGDIIRTGPREISVRDADSVQLIYGPASGTTRGPWYDRIKPITQNLDDFGVFHVRNPVVHAKRRRTVWDKAFNIASLKEYEPMVRKICSAYLVALNQRCGEAISGVDMTKILTFDLIGEVGWGETFQNTEKWKLSPLFDFIEIGTGPQQILAQAPWVLNILVNLPGSDGPLRPYATWIKEKVAAKHKAKVAGKDAMSRIVQGRQDMTLDGYANEGEVLTIAGGDTLSTTLSALIFHLSRHPNIQQKLQKELDAVEALKTETFEYTAVSSLPYVEAVINESLRMQPPVQGGVQRVTPPQGLRLADGTFVPGNIIISAPTLALHLDKRNFVDPHDFIPERWTSEAPEKLLKKHAFIPFSIGPYGCVGKALAWMELKTVVAMLFSRFTVRFAEGEDGRKFLEDTKDCHVTHLGDFKVVWSRRT